jgi:DHA1 family tetracycline resistance protein-like MFS transporter
MTQRVNPAEQGELQGAIGSVGAIAQMIGPVMFSFVFAQSISTTPLFNTHIPGAPFFCSAALLAAAAFVAAQIPPARGALGSLVSPRALLYPCRHENRRRHDGV